MKEFTKEILTEDEISSTEAWTKDSTNIKMSMWGLTKDKVAEKHAKNLFGLFDKYSSNVKAGTVLYRGMSIPDSLYYSMGYDSLKKGSNYTPDNLAITSFSKSKKIAYDFAIENEQNNKVILKVQADDSNMFDITNISKVAKEEETILAKNIWYNVKHIKKYRDGGVRWLLIMLKKK